MTMAPTLLTLVISMIVAQSDPIPAPTPPKPADHPAPAPHAPTPIPATTASITDNGLTLTIPDGWTPEPVGAGAMGVIAAYRLPKAKGDADDGAVRISHFPGMKGKDDMNIDRWIGQVKKPDGTPMKREDGKITKEEKGSIRLTILDISGNLSNSMSAGGGNGVPNQRLIAAIVDHPDGPHFVRVTGGNETIDKWEESVMAALRGAQTDKK